ncbi:MAG: hypothetical protein PWP52_936 [Bacteroidales bacterium]|nr:hypothetical protein [Bacteroidales bacterium]
MKNLLLLVFALISILNIYAQDNVSNKLSESEENDIVIDIRKKFTEIENNCNTSYKRTSKDLNDYSTEGGYVSIFSDNEQIRKAKTTFYGETGKAITEYYFWDNKVFFIFRQNYRYNSPIYITEDTEEGFEAYDENKTKIYEDRYYFLNETLVRWIDENNEKVDRQSSSFNEKQKAILEDIEFIKSKIF